MRKPQTISIQQRQAAWVISHGTEWQARKAELFLKHGVNDALAVLFRRVTEGRP